MREQMYLNVEQVACRYGVHRSTVWRWIQHAKRSNDAGDFPRPAIAMGQTTRWAVADLEEWEARMREAERIGGDRG